MAEGEGNGVDPFGEEWDLAEKIWSTVKVRRLFDPEACSVIEEQIDRVVEDAKKGRFKPCTVDKTPLRTKYFFGEGYIYGSQLKQQGPGNEKLYPKGAVDPIPDWIFSLIVDPIVKAGILPDGFVNSAVINDYLPGGCIVSHIDPPRIFDRPIVTASFSSDSALSFGCKFSFNPMSCTKPVVAVPCKRGCVLSMDGFAANEITHCIRPDDVTHRRAVVILRHVPDEAPRMTTEELRDLQKAGVLPSASVKRRQYRSSKSSASGQRKSSSKTRSGSRRSRNSSRKSRSRSRSSVSSSASSRSYSSSSSRSSSRKSRSASSISRSSSQSSQPSRSKRRASSRKSPSASSKSISSSRNSRSRSAASSSSPSSSPSSSLESAIDDILGLKKVDPLPTTINESTEASTDQGSKIDEPTVKSRIQVLCQLAKVESEIASVAKSIRGGTAVSQNGELQNNKNKKASKRKRRKRVADKSPTKKRKAKRKKSSKNKQNETVEKIDEISSPIVPSKVTKRHRRTSQSDADVKRRSKSASSPPPPPSPPTLTVTTTASKRRVYVDGKSASPVPPKRRIIVDTKSSIELPD